MTTESDVPMPDGVERMTKQQLWNWLCQCQTSNNEVSRLRGKFFLATTGLRASRSYMIGDQASIIEEQRKRIMGLEIQIAQLRRGYEANLRKEVLRMHKPSEVK